MLKKIVSLFLFLGLLSIFIVPSTTWADQDSYNFNSNRSRDTHWDPNAPSSVLDTLKFNNNPHPHPFLIDVSRDYVGEAKVISDLMEQIGSESDDEPNDYLNSEECYEDRNTQRDKSYHQRVVSDFEKLQAKKGSLDSLFPIQKFNLILELAESLYCLYKYEDALKKLNASTFYDAIHDATYDANSDISEANLFKMHLLKYLCYENLGSKIAAWREFGKAAEIIDSPEKNADEWGNSFVSALLENPYYIKDKDIINKYANRYRKLHRRN